MSILDDAIREHLELKRAHGADESELKKLEDEAFGQTERPEEEGNPFAEAPTEFLAQPGTSAEAAQSEAVGGRREPNIADLQEPPEPPKAEAAAPEAPAPEAPAPPEPPADEAHPATEHQAIPDLPKEEPPKDEDEAAPPEASHTTQERHAIAEQPTELFDVESAMESEQPPAEAAAPSDDDLLDAEHAEPRLAPVDPLAGIEAEAVEAEAAEEPVLEDEEEEDDFFSEQRLSDELNQALETPLPGEPQLRPSTEEQRIPPGPHTEETEAHYAEREADAEEPVSEEAELEEPPVQETEEQPRAQFVDFQAEEEEEAGEEEPPAAEEESPAELAGGLAEDVEENDEPPAPAAAYEPEEPDHEDVLEDTPEFLEDAPEDDDLWFEQRPPKDFDFDD